MEKEDKEYLPSEEKTDSEAETEADVKHEAKNRTGKKVEPRDF